MADGSKNEAPTQGTANAAPAKGSVKKWLKRIALALLLLVLSVVFGGGGWVGWQAHAYDASVEKVYDIPVPRLARSTDPAVIARGEHLAHAISACALSDCHGPNLTGGRVTDGGPIGRMAAPNITNILPAYSDGELARLIRHGVKKDGRTVRFMPMNENNWISDSDLVAVISWLRTKPAVDHPTQPIEIFTFGKVIDRLGYVPIDIARRIDHDHVELGPEPSPTAAYGRFIGRNCIGCHGEHLSGGHIPGTPPDFPTPLNITPHATGLAGFSYDDFVRLIETGRRKDGRRLDPFMPVEALRAMDDTERHALWAYLQSVPPTPFGER